VKRRGGYYASNGEKKKKGARTILTKLAKGKTRT